MAEVAGETHDPDRRAVVLLGIGVTDTGFQQPIRQPLRRHLRAHLNEIDRQMDKLLQNGFTEPAASPWASNVVHIRKMDPIGCVSTTGG